MTDERASWPELWQQYLDSQAAARSQEPVVVERPPWFLELCRIWFPDGNPATWPRTGSEYKQRLRDKADKVQRKCQDYMTMVKELSEKTGFDFMALSGISQERQDELLHPTHGIIDTSLVQDNAQPPRLEGWDNS